MIKDIYVIICSWKCERVKLPSCWSLPLGNRYILRDSKGLCVCVCLVVEAVVGPSDG